MEKLETGPTGIKDAGMQEDEGCVASRTRLARRNSVGQLPTETTSMQVVLVQLRWKAEEKRKEEMKEVVEEANKEKRAREEEKSERMEIEMTEENQEKIVKASIEEGRGKREQG